MATAKATVQLDNDRIRVTQWYFRPGEETGFHVHLMDYVVVPLSTGTLRLELTDETRDNELTAGVSYTRMAGSAHNVVNVNRFEFAFIEIELK
jgi:quercetin dioxygenase-like cupin family protein